MSNLVRYARLTVFSGDGQQMFESEEGQRIQFEMTKDVKSAPNSLVVRVYGTPPEEAQAALTRGYALLLEAGTSANHGTLFTGHLIDGFHVNGDRPYMQLTALDGDDFYHGFVSASVGGGESLAGIAALCASRCASPVDVGRISADAGQIRLTRGCVLFGQAADILDPLAKQINGTWFVNDGRLYLLTESDMSFGALLNMDEDDDLVGVPITDAWSVTFGHHIDSRIALCAAVVFNRPEAFGVFRVVSVSALGDTHDGDWKMTVCALRQDAGSPAMSALTRNIWR